MTLDEYQVVTLLWMMRNFDEARYNGFKNLSYDKWKLW